MTRDSTNWVRTRELFYYSLSWTFFDSSLSLCENFYTLNQPLKLYLPDIPSLLGHSVYSYWIVIYGRFIKVFKCSSHSHQPLWTSRRPQQILHTLTPTFLDVFHSFLVEKSVLLIIFYLIWLTRWSIICSPPNIVPLAKKGNENSERTKGV